MARKRESRAWGNKSVAAFVLLGTEREREKEREGRIYRREHASHALRSKAGYDLSAFYQGAKEYTMSMSFDSCVVDRLLKIRSSFVRRFSSEIT